MKKRNMIHWMWLGLLICLLGAMPAHAFYNPHQGRWINRDPNNEEGGLNLYGFVANDPVSDFDSLGEIGYAFDKEHCVLNVTLTYTLEFKGKWDKHQKKMEAWKSHFEPVVEEYFNNQKMKCKSSGCCLCPDGVKVNLDLKLVGGSADWDVYVDWNLTPESLSNLNRWSLESNGSQIPAVHEAGHGLGLEHPGHYLPHPPPPNSEADYYADRNSLMGIGMKLRAADFDRAFCNHLESGSDASGTWSAKN